MSGRALLYFYDCNTYMLGARPQESFLKYQTLGSMIFKSLCITKCEELNAAWILRGASI